MRAAGEPGRPTVQQGGRCGAALGFPTLPSDAETARAIAAFQPWCAAKTPECTDEGRCSAGVATWDAREIGGVAIEAGARVRCESSPKACAETPRCAESGHCTPDSLKVGCVIASKDDCAQSKACKDDGRCKFQESDEEGWMGESMTRCIK